MRLIERHRPIDPHAGNELASMHWVSFVGWPVPRGSGSSAARCHPAAADLRGQALPLEGADEVDVRLAAIQRALPAQQPHVDRVHAPLDRKAKPVRLAQESRWLLARSIGLCQPQS